MIVCIAGFFTALNAYHHATREVPAEGGTYAEGLLGQPSFINPLLAAENDNDADLVELIFANLTTLTEKMAMGPDKKTWTITLKKNLVWSDGKPLTADDVLFTVETLQDPDIRSARAQALQGVIAEKTNDNEIRITLKAPYAFFSDTLTSLKIAPRHIFVALPPANMRLSAYNLEPVGNGPYRITKRATEKDGFIKELTLERNAHYAGKKPLISTITIRFYRNEQTLIEAFNTKRIDGLGGLNPELITNLKINHALKTLFMPRYYAVFFNQSAHPALKEKAVRAALAESINRTALIEKTLKGYAAETKGPLPHVIEGYAPNAYLHNNMREEQKAAQELLEKNGWLVNPEDGIRYKTIQKNRVALAFHLIVPDIPFLVTAAQELEKQWGALGIKTHLVITAADEINDGALKTRNYEMLLFGNILKNNPDVFAFWHSSQKFYPGLNLALYENKNTDKVLESIRGAFTAEERAPMLYTLQETIREDAPATFLFNPAYLYAVPRAIHGTPEGAIETPSERFANIENWYTRTRRTFAKSPAP